jgi:GTP-binding protein EngB required for normal cell division
MKSEFYLGAKRMTTEQQLIEKVFYETFMIDNPEKEPIQVLGEAYLEEQKKDIPDLSAIRFAQGELYFHFKDYESAIFKWENIQNEWEQWAKKNTADAYFELGLLPTAEDIYKSIATEDLTLHTEVSLQLFSLYTERNKQEHASDVIKEIIELNPDYPNVTKLARSFFEGNQDWSSAIELAMKEAVRLGSSSWYDALIGYVEKGRTKMMDPNYFETALIELAKLDSNRFERLSAALWNSYKEEESHITWMFVFNRVIAKLDSNIVCSWKILSGLYEESYLKLINGTHLIKEVGALIPELLTSWMKICDSSYALSAASSVISWNEMFPLTLADSAIYEAENVLLQLDKQTSGFEEAIRLEDEINSWAVKHDLQVSNTLTWIMNVLKEKESYKLAMVGTLESGKSSVINTVMGREVVPEDNTALVVMDHSVDPKIVEISESDIHHVNKIEERPSFRHQRSFHAKLNSAFLQESQLTLIDTPSLTNKKELFSCLHAADGVLFVLNANTPFTDKEQQMLQQIREERPNVPIHFMMNKMDSVYDEQRNTVNETWARIKQFEPNADLFAFSSYYDRQSQLKDLGQYIRKNYNQKNAVTIQTTNLLYFIKKSIKYLVSKRIEKEKALVDAIKWNEEMAAKLNGAVHQIGDLEVEKVRVMTKSYRTIEERMEAELVEKIPQLLRGCSQYIEEDSNFGNLHIELNEKMNKEVENYLQETVMPEYFKEIQKWIADSTVNFNEVQFFINEMCEGFNALYDEDKLHLECDFRVLDDWRRDADRMTSGIHLEKLNILLRFTPSQFILKSAGKLLGGLTQNKSMLYNKYKQYVENEDYHEVAELIAKRFLQQFDLFAKSIERDITIFFRSPLDILNQTVEETYSEIETSKNALGEMRKNPEWYQDPLTFFELKLRQSEWLNQKERKMRV